MKNVILQDVVFPQDNICAENNLYYRQIGFPESELIPGKKIVSAHCKFSFDTYFNVFSLLKWKKYCGVHNVFLSLTLEGKFTVTLIHAFLLDGGKVEYKELEKLTVNASEKQEVNFEFKTENPFGFLTFRIETESNNCVLYSACYFTKTDKKPRDVKLAIGICTYKRESYVYNNINNLNNCFINNEKSELFGKLHVFISDNGGTLENIDSEYVHLSENKNTGGSGGFTRCMISAIDNKDKYGLTHLLLMDDDIVFDPAAIYRTYKILTLLEDEYIDSFIGGAMFEINRPNIQHASGEFWVSDNPKSFVRTYNCNRDMLSILNILENENLVDANYQAWWYCTMPMKYITNENLPYPFFIKSDDIEFSFRNMKHLILLNGINVWHESFESKYSAQNEYYTVRNYLIAATVSNVKLTKEMVIDLLYSYFKHYLANYKYIEMRYFCDAINDYLKGFNHFRNVDLEKFHKTLKKGYKLLPISEIPFDVTDKRFIEDTSYNPHWSKIKSFFAKITLYGSLLPARGYSVLGVWGGSREQCYRKKALVRYEPKTKKAFVLYRSRKESVKLVFLYIRTKRNVRRKFKKAYNDFQNNKSILTSRQNWDNLLRK